MSERVTDWFPGDVKPALPGWYQREWDTEESMKACDYWDGADWYIGAGGKTPSSIKALSPRRWRGLAEDPSAA
jgi:hypothetical protein